MSFDLGARVVCWRRRTWILAAGVLVAACGGGDATPSAVTVGTTEPTSTTATTVATTTTIAVEAAVEQAFHEQWDAFIEILSDPDPANPLIDRYFTGRAKERVLDTVSDYVAEDKIAQRPTDPKHFEPRPQRIEVISGTEALVIECTIDGSLQLDRATGQVIDDEIYRVHFRNFFLLEEGLWKVKDTVSVGEEEPPCELD